MYYVFRIFSRITTWIAIPALFAAAWFSIHLARADAEFRRGDPDSVARAIAIEPRNTEYLALRALELDYAGEDAAPALERAASLSPMSSSPRIRLGLAAEIRGDYASAERWLLDAARVDRQFEPRWTLANFYFRRENARAFWVWMRAALEVSYGDRRPAFELCWRMGGADEILSLAIPDRHEVMAAYLAITLDSHRDSIAPVAMKLARFHDSGDAPLLLAACDALIEANDATRAIELWRAMGYAAPTGVFNGAFSSAPLNRGFDWRAIESPGVTHSSIDQPRSVHRISLDGRQPESCALLIQVLNLEPRARYLLKWEVQMSGGVSLSGHGFQSGIEWRMGDQRAAVGPASTGEAAFTAPSSLAPLTLYYQRPSGQARAEGWIDLNRVSIERAR